MVNHAEKVQAFRAQEQEKLEQRFLSGQKDAALGVFCDLFSAKGEVAGQDGGVVTSLLVKGFREGLFDAAVVVRRTQGDMAEAVVALSAEDVLASAKGTSYLKVNVTKKLRELINQGKQRIAIVCTPCETKAARIIQQTVGKDCQITVIGLFCFEAFNPVKLKEEIQKRLGVDLTCAERMQVRQGKFTVTVKGKAVSCSVKDLSDASEDACRFCEDFVAALADVSVGSVGASEGDSTVIVRSPAGERLLCGATFTRDGVNRREIEKLVKFKKEGAQKSFNATEKP